MFRLPFSQHHLADLISDWQGSRSLWRRSRTPTALWSVFLCEGQIRWCKKEKKQKKRRRKKKRDFLRDSPVILGMLRLYSLQKTPWNLLESVIFKMRTRSSCRGWIQAPSQVGRFWVAKNRRPPRRHFQKLLRSPILMRTPWWWTCCGLILRARSLVLLSHFLGFQRPT